MKRLLLTILAIGLTPGACDRAGSPSLEVLTYNVYWGARVEELLLVENPNDIPLEVARLFAQVQATDFSERTQAIVDQIEHARPHLIGLQEIALYRRQSPSNFQPGAPPDASDVAIDFLGLLLQALADRGLHYSAAAAATNFDMELPMVVFDGAGNPVGLDDIRLTDFDVILVRGDVAWSNPQSANFAAALPLNVGGLTILKPSGWASVDLTFKGLPYRFVNTHLEPADIAPGVVDPDLALLQAAQIAELLAIVDNSPHPTIMVGDFNSDDDGSTTATYQDVIDAGFVDAWLIGPARGDGFTANQAPDLLNSASQLFHRIDFVFYRDDFTRRTGKFQGAVKADVVGDEQVDRTSSGLWPSDHAGVNASLTIAPGRGHAN